MSEPAKGPLPSDKMPVIIAAGVVALIVIYLVISPFLGYIGGGRNYFTPEELLKEYQSNEVAFRSQYIGKAIRMRGKIQSIQERFSPGYRITLGEGFHTVDCNVEEQHKQKLLGLRTGQGIEVIGTVQETFLSSVDLFECQLSNWIRE